MHVHNERMSIREEINEGKAKSFYFILLNWSKIQLLKSIMRIMVGNYSTWINELNNSNENRDERS